MCLTFEQLIESNYEAKTVTKTHLILEMTLTHYKILLLKKEVGKPKRLLKIFNKQASLFHLFRLASRQEDDSGHRWWNGSAEGCHRGTADIFRSCLD